MLCIDTSDSKTALTRKTPLKPVTNRDAQRLRGAVEPPEPGWHLPRYVVDHLAVFNHAFTSELLQYLNRFDLGGFGEVISLTDRSKFHTKVGGGAKNTVNNRLFFGRANLGTNLASQVEIISQNLAQTSRQSGSRCRLIIIITCN